MVMIVCNNMGRCARVDDLAGLAPSMARQTSRQHARTVVAPPRRPRPPVEGHMLLLQSVERSVDSCCRSSARSLGGPVYGVGLGVGGMSRSIMPCSSCCLLCLCPSSSSPRPRVIGDRARAADSKGRGRHRSPFPAEHISRDGLGVPGKIVPWPRAPKRGLGCCVGKGSTTVAGG